ncbi:hypothetical protein BGZ95_003025 [Linnemannia exigua]|uniref:Uncharacterized protein n=1 Tax=Linnemannia exigua TaxID=604196 RepID=A0AAD4H9S3_9FUNG|nr:hypothetical protein BGZ95_003025 [Linnemannia exigua]
MLNFTDYALQDSHQHMDFRSTYLCYLNHVHDCRQQTDAEAMSLQLNGNFLAACKEEYTILTKSKVSEAVRVGAAHLLTGEIELQVEETKEELGHNNSSAAARPPHDSSANALPLTPASNAMLSSKAQDNHKQQPADLPRYTPSNLSQAQQEIYDMNDNVKDKPTQSATDIAHEENQPEVNSTGEEITEIIDPTSAESGTLDCVNVAPPADAYPITTLEDLEQEPGSNFGMCLRYDLAWHPIRSFMIDLQDKYSESLFSPQDWIEIKSNLPHSATYSSETAAYLDTLADMDEEQDIIKVRPV